MKRSLTVNFEQNQREGFSPGDAAAHRAAAALADRADMPTIDFFSTILSLLETIGGQSYVTALRVENEGGEFDTMGLILNFETRDARIEFFDAPDEVAGVPVTDSAGPGTKVEIEPDPVILEAMEEADELAEEEPEPAEDPDREPEPALSD